MCDEAAVPTGHCTAPFAFMVGVGELRASRRTSDQRSEDSTTDAYTNDALWHDYLDTVLKLSSPLLLRSNKDLVLLRALPEPANVAACGRASHSMLVWYRPFVLEKKSSSAHKVPASQTRCRHMTEQLHGRR